MTSISRPWESTECSSLAKHRAGLLQAVTFTGPRTVVVTGETSLPRTGRSGEPMLFSFSIESTAGSPPARRSFAPPMVAGAGRKPASRFQATWWGLTLLTRITDGWRRQALAAAKCDRRGPAGATFLPTEGGPPRLA